MFQRFKRMPLWKKAMLLSVGVALDLTECDSGSSGWMLIPPTMSISGQAAQASEAQPQSIKEVSLEQ